MYWSFLFSLFVGAFVTPTLFSFVVGPLLGLLVLTSRDRMSILSYVVIAVSFVAQVYFWVGWASYCTFITVLATADSSVTFVWLYYVTAFIFLVMPIGYLRTQEERGAQDEAEIRRIGRGSNLYDVLTIVAFIAFCLFPSAMAVPYGWFLRFLV